MRGASPPAGSERVGCHAWQVYRLCDALVDDVITVSSDEIASAIRDCFDDTRSLLEPHGAISIAGLKKYALAQQRRRAAAAKAAETAAEAEAAASGGSLVAIASDASNIEFDLLQQFAREKAAAASQ